MGADNQAEKVIDRMEREEMLVDAAARLIRELQRECTLSESGLMALLDLKSVIMSVSAGRVLFEEKPDAP